MFADMEESLRQQFTIDVPTYKEYAQVVAGTMAQHYAASDMKPRLITEPGTTLVSRYLSLITKVTAIKKVKGKKVAIVDSDVHNVGETAQMMKVPYTHYQSGKGSVLGAPLDITGYTCLEQDVLYKDFPQSVKVGDIIEFRNVGGYSVVYKPPFIQPNCAMVSMQDNGTVKEIKRRETFDDILVTYMF
jgi:diaminopimelate decarboxylase